MRSFALVVLLFVAYACAQLTNLSSVNSFGIDMIMIDSPSWVTKIQKSFHQSHELLIFGETTQRAVVGSPTGQAFTAVPVSQTWLSNPFEMLDLETFPYFDSIANYTATWTIGVTDFTVDQAASFLNINSSYLPLVYIRPSGANWLQQPLDPVTQINWSGTMFSAVNVDWRNYSDVQAYYAGFETHIDVNNFLVTTFGIFRTHLNILAPTGGTNKLRFTTDFSTEAALLYTGQFTSFSASYKPFVHILPYFGPQNITMIVVTDPNTRTIYSGYFSPTDNFTTGGWTPVYSVPINIKFAEVVSATMDFQTGKLYVGVAQSGGNNTGSIAVIDLFFNTANVYSLPLFCNNPKALALDSNNSLLYIGLNGASEVLRYDLNLNNVTGYQRLPEWLHRSWDATEFPDHIYFVTNEEHSKVYRVNKVDFCTSRCPYNGYCSNGKCECGQGFTMDAGNCQPTSFIHERTIERRVHGGEVALGILFAIMTVAAGSGWYLWYRGRRGSHQAM